MFQRVTNVYNKLTKNHVTKPKSCPNIVLSLLSSKKEELLDSFETFLENYFCSKSHGQPLKL